MTPANSSKNVDNNKGGEKVIINCYSLMGINWFKIICYISLTKLTVKVYI